VFDLSLSQIIIPIFGVCVVFGFVIILMVDAASNLSSTVCFCVLKVFFKNLKNLIFLFLLN
jgi:hypothetical protein